MKLNADTYFNLTEHKETTRVLLELLKRTVSRYNDLGAIPPHRIIFREPCLGTLSFTEICEAASHSNSLMSVASDGHSSIIVLDATHLNITDDLIERLEKIVNPAPPSKDTWDKMVQHLKSNEEVAYNETNLTTVCKGNVADAYERYNSHNMYVRRYRTNGATYYIYLK